MFIFIQKLVFMNSSKQKIRILSIDGGGIRGVIPAVVMEYVEEKLIELSGNPDARIADYFDLFVGTSTGGILSCFYLTPDIQTGRPKYRAAQATEFYSRHGYGIFNESKRSKWGGLRQIFDATAYDARRFEAVLNDTFGEVRFSQLLRRCVITTYDIHKQSAFFFNSREPEHKKRDFLLREAVRSTAAAPTYFPPARIKNIITGEELLAVDGGVFANNPALCAYAEARHTDFGQLKFPETSDMLVLSLGTGGGNLDFGHTGDIHGWGAIRWAKAAPDIMMDGSVDTVEFQMKQLFGALEEGGIHHYKRIDVPAQERKYKSDMADASPENIARLREAGKAALEHARKSEPGRLGLDQFLEALVQNA
jgi:patatin-like phospholipase/acyl hydrolase